MAVDVRELGLSSKGIYNHKIQGITLWVSEFKRTFMGKRNKIGLS